MGRSRKTLFEGLKAAVMAHALADAAGIKPNGYQIAKWFERKCELPNGTVDKRTFENFLNGQMPQKERLVKLIELEPLIGDLYNHPLWKILGGETNQYEIDAVVHSAIRPGKTFTLTKIRNVLFQLSPLDRITLIVAISLSSVGHGFITSYLTEWLADSYAQLLLETTWAPLACYLLEILLARCEGASNFSALRLTSSIHDARLKFWRSVFEDHVAHNTRQDPRAWSTWCGAISRLDWTDQQHFLAYINEHRGVQQESDPRLIIFKKVRKQYYRCLQSTPKFSIEVFASII